MPVLVVLLVLVLLAPAGAEEAGVVAPAASAAAPAVHITDRAVADAVSSALDGATRRLGHSRCRAVLDHPGFQDGRGRSMATNLAALGRSGPAYLRSLAFEDGRDTGFCAEKTLAFTNGEPGVVYVCPRFLRAWKRERLTGEVALIHEALHTLGLGENPPASGHITDTIASYCGG